MVPPHFNDFCFVYKTLIDVLPCQLASQYQYSQINPVADPGFPIGGRGPRTGGRGPLRRLHFENFACQNERIWTRRGGARRARPPRSANEIIVFKRDFCLALNLFHDTQLSLEG